MKKRNKLRLKYVYVEPKTKEEKTAQQKIIDDIFDSIFERIIRKRNDDDSTSKRNSG